MRYQDKVQKLTTDVDRMEPTTWNIIPADLSRKLPENLDEYRGQYRDWQERTKDADFKIPMTAPDDLPDDFFLTGVKQI